MIPSSFFQSIKKVIAHSNMYWFVFITLLTLLVLGYTALAMAKGFSYFRLTEHVSPSSIRWSVFSDEVDSFRPRARYEFTYKDTPYQGETRWDDSYLNEPTAREAIQPLTKESFVVWFDPLFPTHSTLQKYFPFKQFISAAILWILLFYFVRIGRHVAKYHP